MGGFNQSSSNIRLEGTVLHAHCKTASGKEHQSRIDLNAYFGNNNGSFDKGGQNFAGSARNIRLNEHGVLVCGLKKADGSWNPGQKLNIHQIIDNHNGQLVMDN